ncbi:DUF1642 domain-containing protein [Streptococcus koreensis]|uniref:DUF1642 domain-containing protein n=1 Tax=Streptococcus koreensis TaxID=2382163 RepID=UPI003CE9B194
MNKQELIEHIGNTLDKYLKNTTFVKPVLSITEIAKSDKVSLEFEIGKSCILLDDVSHQFGYDKGKLDGEWVGQQLKDADKIRQELNKPVVPQFVADYIDFKKENDFHVYGAMRVIEDHYDKRVPQWFYEKNIETFARAWLDGYTVEKEKRYRVKMKNAYYNKYPQFLCETDNGIFWAAEIDLRKTKFTRKELEQAGFGWVFDCPGVEVWEVEE